MHQFLSLVLFGSLLYLLVDGWVSGSVWVKGTRHAIWSLTEWGHKRSRDEEPGSYWGVMGFYAAGFVWISYQLAVSA